MKNSQKICSKCICDSTIPEIRFDSRGVCQYCHMHDIMEKIYPLTKNSSKELEELVYKIKNSGKGREYDSVVGVSGGRDSSYLLYTAVKLGLRPLAVHFDNGWNSEIAVRNIEKITRKLNVDLITHVANWQEFKSLQKSFLKASVSDAEIPTDVAIFGTVIRAADKEKIKYTLNGHSFRTEGIMPRGWTYMDGRYIKSVHAMFGKEKLHTVPNFTLFDYLHYIIFKKIQIVPLLNFFEYDQKKIDKILTQELDWTYSGGHHHESHYTHFFQSYLLPVKFKIDKRKIEMSALIRSGQLSRDSAIKKISKTAYPYEQELIDYTINKLDISKTDFADILKAPVKTYRDYPTYFPLITKMKHWVEWAYRKNLVSELLYLKYLG